MLQNNSLIGNIKIAIFCKYRPYRNSCKNPNFIMYIMYPIPWTRRKRFYTQIFGETFFIDTLLNSFYLKIVLFLDDPLFTQDDYPNTF